MQKHFIHICSEILIYLIDFQINTLNKIFPVDIKSDSIHIPITFKQKIEHYVVLHICISEMLVNFITRVCCLRLHRKAAWQRSQVTDDAYSSTDSTPQQ